MKIPLIKQGNWTYFYLDGKEVYLSYYPGGWLCQVGSGWHETSDRGWVYLLDNEILTGAN